MEKKNEPAGFRVEYQVTRSNGSQSQWIEGYASLESGICGDGKSGSPTIFKTRGKAEEAITKAIAYDAKKAHWGRSYTYRIVPVANAIVEADATLALAWRYQGNGQWQCQCGYNIYVSNDGSFNCWHSLGHERFANAASLDEAKLICEANEKERAVTNGTV